MSPSPPITSRSGCEAAGTQTVATPTGLGYWLLGSDGGVFTEGDATYRGSAGAMILNEPIVDMLPTMSGAGYWLIAGSGALFTFGDATYPEAHAQFMERSTPTPIVGGLIVDGKLSLIGDNGVATRLGPVA